MSSLWWRASSDNRWKYKALLSFGVTMLLFALSLGWISPPGAVFVECSPAWFVFTACISTASAPQGRDANPWQEVSEILFCHCCVEWCPTPRGTKLSHLNTDTHEFVMHFLQAFFYHTEMVTWMMNKMAGIPAKSMSAFNSNGEPEKCLVAFNQLYF